MDHSSLLWDETDATAAVGLLSRLSDAQAAFQIAYRKGLRALLGHGKPTVVCTIYDSIPGIRGRERVGLSLFNDVILREAFRACIPLIDLRLICTDSDDYAKSSPIEPSTVGGAKIARAIVRAIAPRESESEGSRVYV